MKTLDPFSGYRLACGHPFFHVAFFVCSYIVSPFGLEEKTSDDEISSLFILMRWSHFFLVSLSVLVALLQIPSEIPQNIYDDQINEMRQKIEAGDLTEKEKKELDEKIYSLKALSITKIITRDNSKQLCSRIF